MIFGIGVDICSIERIEKNIKNLGCYFYNLILTKNEIKQYKFEKDSAKFLAHIFAAKEAFYKAFNSPNQKLINWKDVEVCKQKNNLYKLELSEKTKHILEKSLPKTIHYNVKISFFLLKKFVICTIIISYL